MVQTVKTGKNRHTSYGYLSHFNDQAVPKHTESSSSRVAAFGNGDNYKTYESNPSWKVQVVKGQNASLPYRRSTWVLKDSGVGLRGATQSVPFGYPGYPSVRSFASSGVIGTSFPTPGLGNADDLNKASSKFKNKLRDVTPHAKSLAPLVESRELKRLVVNTNNICEDFIDSTVSFIAHRRLGPKVRKELYNQWLNFSFGISPLLSDIRQIGNSIAEHIARRDTSVRTTATNSSSGHAHIPCSTSAIYVPQGMTAFDSGRVVWTNSCRIVGAYDFPLSSSEDYSILNSLGLGWNDIPYTLWELTPYSWLLDYFVTVGPFLEDAFYVPPGTTKYLVATVKYDATYDFSHEYVYKKQFNLTSLGSRPSVSKFAYSYVERQVLQNLPCGSLRIKTPDVVGRNWQSKITNLVSILRP